jgi:hypothetical protein
MTTAWPFVALWTRPTLLLIVTSLALTLIIHRRSGKPASPACGFTPRAARVSGVTIESRQRRPACHKSGF